MTGGYDDAYSAVFSVLVLDGFYLHFCRFLFARHKAGIEGRVKVGIKTEIKAGIKD
jgi:hypothetical protein